MSREILFDVTPALIARVQIDVETVHGGIQCGWRIRYVNMRKRLLTKR
jgi:hypothetical protein